MARGPGTRAKGGGRGKSFSSGIKSTSKRGGSKQKGVDEAPFGLDDIDAFHKQRDQVKLAVSEDDDDSEADSELDAAAYELERGSDSEESDSEEEEDEFSEEEDQDAALQAAIRRGGRIGKLAKAAKAVGAKVALQQGLDEEEADAEDADEDLERRRLWGANKRAYHGADETDDEEAAKEEEEEALRLQREQQAALRPEDYDDSHLFPDANGAAASSSEDEDSDEDAEPALGDVATAQANGKVHVERLQRDGGAVLATEEARALVERDAPELLALLDELKDSLQELRSRVGPVLAQVKAGELATAEGLSYLEAKHLLLLSYCIHIVFYVLLKAEGAPVRSHPVIGRLLQLRTYLEKLRPIDKKLAYQIEKLLAAGQRAEAGGGDDAAGDPLSYGPRPEQLVPRVPTGNAAEDADAGVYRPPRLAAAAMEDDPDKRRSAKERRREREASRRGGRSALLQELAQEVEGAPEEAPAGGAGGNVGAESAAARRQMHALAARAAIEEELMMRVPLSKEQRKSLKAQRRAALSGKALNDDFADDVAELVAAAGGEDAAADDILSRRTVSQRYGADAVINPRGRSGDEDLPVREPLHERRAKYDTVKARHAAAAELDSGGGGGSKRKKNADDPEYQALAAEPAERKKARKEARAVPDTLPPLPDPAAEGARKITTAIEKNRGLTPHRNKAGKNPRKKNRTKFEKAKVRRGGQVQEAREKTAGYGGEATGIKAKVSKSRRF